MGQLEAWCIQRCRCLVFNAPWTKPGKANYTEAATGFKVILSTNVSTGAVVKLAGCSRDGKTVSDGNRENSGGEACVFC